MTLGTIINKRITIRFHKDNLRHHPRFPLNGLSIIIWILESHAFIVNLFLVFIFLAQESPVCWWIKLWTLRRGPNRRLQTILDSRTFCLLPLVNNGFSLSSFFLSLLSFLWIGAQFPQEKFLSYGRILTLDYYFLLMCILFSFCLFQKTENKMRRK